jgi:hypothetical protein
VLGTAQPQDLLAGGIRRRPRLLPGTLLKDAVAAVAAVAVHRAFPDVLVRCVK